MTLQELLDDLKSMAGDMPLVFVTQVGDIGPGYHITEFKHARVTGIDCGARQAQWDETAIQLLDGAQGTHMSVGKFAGILEQSIKRIADLASPDTHVEFSHGNIGMRTYSITPPVQTEGRVEVQLSEGRAYCKPAQDQQVRALAASSACCSGSTSQSACCG
ncbi:DUF6428 family protein [Ahrensia sp. 13_GOM-1096m]|uniref:DUF6428 family protein n=1 Tax=Ahrensia sp. 13_GOM-1096m TaxID=1380380 RepID=UPI00047D012B|nr:DUF6428 family protein [Ahrensia sp. 13_GOM-1096m]